MSNTAEPTKRRIALLDVLRGLALLGILLVNMEYFGQTVHDGWARPEYDNPTDLAAIWLILAFLQAKAYLLFALLFGYGLGLQIEGARGPLVARHLRRMTVLLLIGVAHAILLFAGDILVTYAIIGMLTVPLWRTASRRLIRLAVAGYGLCLVVAVALIATFPEGEPAGLDTIREIYATGSFSDIVQQRIRDLGAAFPFVLLLQGPMAFAMFLVGIVMARTGVLTDPSSHVTMLQRIVRWGLPAGLLGSAAAATLTIIDPVGIGVALGFILQLLTAPALSLAYVGLLGLLFARKTPGSLLLAERHPGRMSLTIYVGESLLGALVFTGIGLGLYGQIGPAMSTLIAVALWVVCLAFSLFWTKRFRFGPLEWLLRSATYWRWQPLRIHSPKSSHAYPTGTTAPSTRTRAPRSPE